MIIEQKKSFLCCFCLSTKVGWGLESLCVRQYAGNRDIFGAVAHEVNRVVQNEVANNEGPAPELT